MGWDHQSPPIRDTKHCAEPTAMVWRHQSPFTLRQALKMQGTAPKCRNTPVATTIEGISHQSLHRRKRLFSFKCSLFLFFVFLLSPVFSLGSWGGSRGLNSAKISIDYVHGPLADTITRFQGNKSQVDNFKIVVEDGQAIFVGGT